VSSSSPTGGPSNGDPRTGDPRTGDPGTGDPGTGDPRTGDPPTHGPLAGLRVVDLTHHVAGPFCTKLLAAYGAEVIKVERPGCGDPARGLAPFIGSTPDPEGSLAFLDLNSGKLGVTLDLAAPPARDLLLRMVGDADVVVESFRPGVMDRLGLSYEELDRARPGIVVTSLSSFGQTGPYRDLSASEIVLYAMGHAMFGTGQPDREPLSMAPRLSLYFAGLTACVATVSAVLGRRRNDGGDHADVSIMETLLASIDRRADSLVACDYCGERMDRLSVMPDAVPPMYNRCRDGYFTVVVGGRTQWGRLAQALDAPWILDARFVPPTADAEARAEFEAYWSAWCAARGKHEIVDHLQAAGLAAAPINTVADVVDDPHLAARRFFPVVADPRTGPVRHTGLPFVPAATRGGVRRPAPRLGEHNAVVFGRYGSDADALDGRRQAASPPGDVSAVRAPGTAHLAGVRVIDLGVVLAGPHAAMVLGDLGAEVIRVESTRHFAPLTRGRFARPSQDWVRSQPPITGGYPDRDPGERPWNRYPWFNATARNKLGMTVDLDRPEGRDIVRRLAAVSDVLVTNQTPGSLESQGLGYGDLAAVNPGLVYVEASPFGSSGPHRRRRALGIQMESFAGHDTLRGYPDDGHDANTWAVPSDATGSMAVVLAALMGLYARDETGRGQYVDVSMIESFLSLIGPIVLDRTVNGVVQATLGNRDYQAVQGCYPCAGDDRWVVLTVHDDESWAGLRRALGEPAWSDDPALATAGGRRAQQDVIDAGISAWTRDRSRDDVVAALRSQGVVCGPVMDDADALADPHLRERGFFVTVDQADAGRHRYPGPPFRFRRVPFTVRHPPVRLGGDNERVYRDVLGVSDDEYDRLVADGHIGEEYAPDIP
jgi:crotonobetainyl-CoA:carnitine CoA-transferase CaiB-like acyl-CoA transferase